MLRLLGGIVPSQFVPTGSLLTHLLGDFSPVNHKDHIRAENKVQSISKLFIPQAIVPQVSLPPTTTQIISAISER